MTDKIAFASEMNPGVDEDALFLIGEDGTELWAKTITDDATPPEAAYMYAVAVDPSGNVYTAGQTWIGVLTGPGVSKWSSAGALLWNVMVSTVAPMFPFRSIAVTPSGDVIVGTSRRDMGGGAFGTVFLLSGADGSVTWYKDGGAGSAAFFVAADAAGNVYALMADALWSWESDGTLRWTTAAFDPAKESGLAIDPTSTWAYVGYGTELIGRFTTAGGAEDTSGDWPIDLNIDNNSYAAGIACDYSGYLYVAYTYALGTSFGIRKYSPAAALIWDTTPADSVDVYSVAVSSGGYVYVSGATLSTDLGGGFKMLADDGTEITSGWPKEFPNYSVYVAASPGCVGAFMSAWSDGGYPGPSEEWPTEEDGGGDWDNDGVEDGPGWHDGGGGFPGSPPNIYVGRVDFE